MKDRLCWDGLDFSKGIGYKDFAVFEKNNPNIRLSVWTPEPRQKKMAKLWLSPKREQEGIRTVNLLDCGGHYLSVESVSRLLAGQLGKKKAPKYLCEYCDNPVDL